MKVKRVLQPVLRRREPIEGPPKVDEVKFQTPLFHGGDWARCVASACDDEGKTYVLTAVATVLPNVLTGKVFVHDAETGHMVNVLGKGGNFKNGDVVAMACYGMTVVTGDGMGVLATFNVKTAECYCSVLVTDKIPITSLVVVERNKTNERDDWQREALIVGTVSGQCMVFDLANNKVGHPRWIQQIHVGRIWSIASYADTVVTAGEDGKVIEWKIGSTNRWIISLISVNSWTSERPVRYGQVAGKWTEKSPVRSVAVGGKWIASGTSDEVQVRRRRNSTSKFKIARPRIIMNCHPNQWIHSISINAESGKMVTVGGDGTLMLYDLNERKVIFRVSGDLKELGSGSAIWSAAVMPLGRVAICGPWDQHSYILDCRPLWERKEESILSVMIEGGVRAWKRMFRMPRLSHREGSIGGNIEVPEPIARRRSDLFSPSDSASEEDISSIEGGPTGMGVTALMNEVEVANKLD